MLEHLTSPESEVLKSQLFFFQTDLHYVYAFKPADLFDVLWDLVAEPASIYHLLEHQQCWSNTMSAGEVTWVKPPGFSGDGSAIKGPRTKTDAILSCPGCFTVICFYVARFACFRVLSLECRDHRQTCYSMRANTLKQRCLNFWASPIFDLFFFPCPFKRLHNALLHCLETRVPVLFH